LNGVLNRVFTYQLSFDVANLKQRVFKNKKCQRFFLRPGNIFPGRGIFILIINFLAKTFSEKNSKTKSPAFHRASFWRGCCLINFCTFVGATPTPPNLATPKPQNPKTL
jgi:hypothetical protein